MCSPTCSPVLPVQSHSITLLRSIIEMTFLTLFLSRRRRRNDDDDVLFFYISTGDDERPAGHQASGALYGFTIKIQR